MVEWCTKQGYTETLFPLRGLGALWPCSGSATPPKPPVAPARSAPSGRSARRLLRSGEWGDLAAERLKGEKIPRFQDQGLDPGSTGR